MQLYILKALGYSVQLEGVEILLYQYLHRGDAEYVLSLHPLIHIISNGTYLTNPDNARRKTPQIPETSYFLTVRPSM